MSAERRIIHELPSGQFRDLEPSEMEQALADEARLNDMFKDIRKLREALTKAEKQVADLTRGCPHFAAYDIPGHIYDTRICMRCGHGSYL